MMQRLVLSLFVIHIAAAAACGTGIFIGRNSHPQAVIAFNDLVSRSLEDSQFVRDMFDEIDRARNADIVLTLVMNERAVWFDSKSTRKVDMGDILTLPEEMAPRKTNQTQLLVHILWEQLLYQNNSDDGLGCEVSHARAIDKEGDYREDPGGTTPPQCDRVRRRRFNESGSARRPTALCEDWTKNGVAQTTPTYVPIPDQISNGKADPPARLTLGGGEVERFTFVLDEGYPNIDILDVPSAFGGETVDITDFSCTITFEMRPYDPAVYSVMPVAMIQRASAVERIVAGPDPVFRSVRVVGLDGVAPSVPLPPPYFSSGVNQLSALPNEFGEGYYNTETGQLVVAYTGQIVNDLFFRSCQV